MTLDLGELLEAEGVLLECAKGPIPNVAQLVAGEPIPLFTAHVGDIVPLQSGFSISYIISPDGQRFLMDTIVEEPAPAPITVILNWKPGS